MNLFQAISKILSYMNGRGSRIYLTTVSLWRLTEYISCSISPIYVGKWLQFPTEENIKLSGIAIICSTHSVIKLVKLRSNKICLPYSFAYCAPDFSGTYLEVIQKCTSVFQAEYEAHTWLLSICLLFPFCKNFLKFILDK